MNTRCILVCLSAWAVFFFPASLSAELKVAAIFGDHMVLQQQHPVPVWGWADPGAEVKVTFADRTETTRAEADGKWIVRLPKELASPEPRILTVASGTETKIFTDVLVGEVWLCSGQSNMEKPLVDQPNQKPCLNAKEELAAADHPTIRLFKIQKGWSPKPKTDLGAGHGWHPCSPESMKNVRFSAAGYFFGREIHKEMKVPVGLIEASWGGSRIEPFIPAAGFESIPSLAALAQTELNKKKPEATPTVLYNAMLAPIAGYALRGTLWYQGESNCGDKNNETYADLMAALVGGWRKAWGQGDFPLYFVQLVPYRYTVKPPTPRESVEVLPRFWAIQSRAARRIPNTGVIVTTDLADDLDDVHPRDKLSVGHRLALLALNKTYGKEIPSSGPVFKRMTVTGNKAILEFDHVHGGLISKDEKPLTWFTVAGPDGKFVEAEAQIAGDTVEITAPGIDQPHVVRFAWHETAQPNFFNRAGLPAEPFRTDEPLD
jgi:sialate O-acetylesterase